MISDKLLTEYSYIVSARFEAINTRYIKLMARQIKEIGKLTPSNIKRLEQMSKMSTNIAEINNLLATESNMTLNELYKVYDMSGMSIYQDAEKLYKSNGKTQVPFEQNARLQSHLESMKMLTKGTFSNLSNTTAMHEGYRQLVDMALDAVASGTDNYQAVIDNILTNPDLSSLTRSVDGGLRVQYASGYTRRLDSAVRMNVLSGLRELNNGVNEIAGKEFGADGVEITAHALCAEDHLPVQGRQFAKGPAREVNGTFYPSFEQMNSQLRRKISTWNCKHSTRVILLGVSGPSYTEEELRQYEDLSTQKVTIGDKEVTRYQASQMMRNLETEMRYAKDKIIFAEEAGFPDIQSKAEQRLTDLRNRYKYVSNQANLQQQLDRTYVPGFKGIGNPKPEDITLKSGLVKQKSLTIENANSIANEAILNQYSHRVNDLGVNFVSYNDVDTFIKETKLGADFTGMDEKLAYSTASQLSKLTNDYETTLISIRVGKLDIDSAPAGTELAMNISQSTMTFNKAIVKDYDKFIKRMDKAVESGQFPKIPKSQYENYVATHEFAHTLLATEGTLKNYVNAPTSNIQKARKEIKDLRQKYEEHLRKLNVEWKELELKSLETFDADVWDRAVKVKDEIDSVTISKYAGMNADEFMAEAFAEAVLSDNPGPYSVKVKAILDKYFKK